MRPRVSELVDDPLPEEVVLLGFDEGLGLGPEEREADSPVVRGRVVGLQRRYHVDAAADVGRDPVVVGPGAGRLSPGSSV